MIGEILLDAGLFHIPYGKLLTELLDAGYEETNQRTGSKIKTLPGAVSFKVDLRTGFLPVCGHRKLYPATMAAEVAWFLSGTKDVTWLAGHAPIWNKFVESDGRTIDAAYGYRWATHFKRDQLDDAVFALSHNPSDRRVYVGTWDPASDGLGQLNQKNVPCPVGFTLSIVNDELHSSILLRSSDVFVGLPYDMGGHALLMQALLVSINQRRTEQTLRLGSMHVTLAHPHLYEAHYVMARESISRGGTFEPPRLIAGWGLSEIKAAPDMFVEAYKAASREAKWPDFSPRPELIV